MCEIKRMHLKNMKVIFCIVLCLCYSACSPKTAATEESAEGNKSELLVTGMPSAQNLYLSDTDCDEETIRRLKAHLEGFFETVEFVGFDQGHTNAVWYWAAQALYQQGKAAEADGVYAVGEEDAKQWISQHVITPKGSEMRMNEGMPKKDAEFPIARSDGKLLFYRREVNGQVSFEVQTALKHDGSYFLGGEVKSALNGDERKSLFSVMIVENAEGDYRLERLNTEGFSSFFLDTKSVPVTEECQKRAEDTWKRVSEVRAQNGTENEKLSSVDMAEAEEMLKFFFGTPMMGSFSQECIGAAVTFSVQKMLRTDLRSLTYHESADYYTISVDDLAEWMRDSFVIPANYDRQVKDAQNDNSLVRIEGDKVVFRYCEPSESEPFCIDGGVEENGRWLIYGHNPLTAGKIVEKQKDGEYAILGATYPYYEFVAVFEKTAERKILLREFYLR